MTQAMKTSMPLLSLALLLYSPCGYGESLLLDEISVRGEKEAPKEESLTIREVRESPARDMGEALKQIEGLDAVRKGAIANDVVLRGMQRDNINVLVDGVRVYGACPSRMDPPSFHYDFAEIEQVRVIKGPYDLTNPGGLGGLVEAQTRQPGTGFGGDATLSYGSWDTFSSAVTGSFGNDLFDGLLGYAYKTSGVPQAGHGRLITDIYPATGVNRYKTDTLDSRAYEINSAWVKFGINPTANSRSEVSYSYQDAEHVLYPYLKMDAVNDRTHRLNWQYRLGNISPAVRDLKLQLYWDQVNHLMDDRLRASSSPTMMVTRDYSMLSDATTRTFGVKLNTALAAGPGTLTSGIDYYNRYWDIINRRAMYRAYADLAMIPAAGIDNLGAFVGYELPLAKGLTFKGGVRGDLTWAEAEKSNTLVNDGASRRFATAGGNLQLTYSPLPGLELFTGIARGSRTPDQEELFLDVPTPKLPSSTSPYWHGNPALKATVNHQADLGVKYATGRFYINGSLFYSDLQHYINFYQPPGTFEKTYQNIHATIWGSELGSQVSLPLDLFLRGSVSYQEGRNRSAGRPLAEIPPLKGTAALRYDNGTFFAEIQENLAHAQSRVDSGLNEAKTGGWETTDVKCGLNYRGVTAIVGVSNVFDTYYYSHLSYARDPFQSGVKVPENGRYLYATIGYAF